jgi:hypothetical protein
MGSEGFEPPSGGLEPPILTSLYYDPGKETKRIMIYIGYDDRKV